jgi:hypothetical protein
MALSRNFKETVRARARRDPTYRRALLREALEQLVNGDVETGRNILGTYINATIGYATLGVRLAKSPKSLMRMLGPSGNPRADNLFEIIRALNNYENVWPEIRLKAHRAGVDRSESFIAAKP